MARTDPPAPLSYADSSVNRRTTLDRWLPLALVLVTLLAYFPVLNAEFVRRDDPMTITENPAMLTASATQIVRFWTNIERPNGNIYIPLTETCWYLLARLAKLDHPGPDGVPLSALPFHLTNLLLHALNGWIVYRTVRRMDLGPWPAAAGGALYLLHPLQVEVVAWVSGLKDVLGATFTLTAIYSYLRFVQARNTMEARAARWYLVATICFILAMFAKPASVVAPLLALIVGIGWMLVARPGSTRKHLLASTVVPVGFWLLLAIPIVLEGHHAQPGSMTPDVAIGWRPFVAADALCFYLWKLLAPVSLGLDYSRTPASIIADRSIYWTWIIPAAVLAAAIAAARRRPLLLVGLLIVFAAPLPVLGFVKFDFQYFSTVSDRYVYVGMLGVGLAAAAIIQMWQAVSITRLCAIGVLVGAGMLTYVQADYWHDDLILWNHAYHVNPRSFAAVWHLGRTFADLSAAERRAGNRQAARDDDDRAISFFEKALPIDPNPRESHRALGELYFEQGEYSKATEHYQAARAGFPYDADLHSNLAMALVSLHRYSEAKAAMEKAIQLKPYNASYEAKLGNILGEQGDRAGAAEHFRRALAIDPKFAPANEGLQKVTGP